MLIISAGMRKAGSGLAYNLIKDMVLYHGGTDAKVLKESNVFLQSFLLGPNARAKNVHFSNIFKAMWFTTKTRFVIKTHKRPPLYLRCFIQLGLVSMIYIYRNPFDALLSSIEFGEKLKREGIHLNTQFLKMADIDQAMSFLGTWLQDHRVFMANGRILKISYEELVTHPIKVMQQIDAHLAFHTPTEDLLKIFNAYQKAETVEQTHLNVGIIGRGKKFLPTEYVERIEKLYGDQIRQLGFVNVD